MSDNSTPEQGDHLLTISEAADLLGTAERFPRRLVAERRVAFVKVGRHVRFRRSDLLQYIDHQVVVPVTFGRPA